MAAERNYFSDESKLTMSSGFFNSLEESMDRVYDAEDISSLFDGLILDGVYLNYGERFNVTAAGGMTLSIGTGRAWFNHTWFVNSAKTTYTVEDVPDLTFKRIDAIVIRVDKSTEVRETQLAYVYGDATQGTPQKPELIDDAFVHEYAIAYISIHGGMTEITTSDIKYVVGKRKEELEPDEEIDPDIETYYVSGIIQQASIAELWDAWDLQFNEWKQGEQDSFNAWYQSLRDIFVDDKDTTVNHLINVVNILTARLDAFGNAEDIAY